ncbi:hypothetical protein, partial [Sandarakinorhabdus sp.]|uniref:beta strand repeat-containing protein n=1 Tax=Sandarakinorhabdus sp. TaxID=1916663 RepID=UPI00286E1E04
NATATSGTLTMGNVTGGALTLEATAGDVIIASIARGDAPNQTAGATSLDIKAGGSATITGAALINGPVTLTTGSAITLADIDIGANALTLTSTNGGITTGNLAGGPLRLTANAATGDVRVGSIGRAISLDVSAGRDINMVGTVAMAGPAVLMAGRDLTTAGIDTGSGAITATATAGTLTMGNVAGGALNLKATAGNAIIASIARGTTLVLTTGRNGTITGNTAITGNAALTAGAAPAGGNLSLGAIDSGNAEIVAKATNGTLATGNVAGGAITLEATGSAGDATIASVSRAASLTVTAGRNAVITGAATASGAATLTAANNLTTAAVTAGALKATATAGELRMANIQAASLEAVAGTIANLLGSATVTGNYAVTAPDVRLGLGSGGNHVVGGTAGISARIIDLGGTTDLVSTGRTTLTVTGAGTVTAIGGAGTDRLLDSGDLARFRTAELQVLAGSKKVTLEATDLFANVRSVGVTTSGDIEVVGALQFATAAGAPIRTLTLGGDATKADTDETADFARSVAVVAVPTQTNATPFVGGQLLAAGSTVRLRATYIALGMKPLPTVGLPFIDALLPAGGTPPTTDVVRGQYLINPVSSLYTPAPQYALAKATIVDAARLVLTPVQWALIQNTDRTAQPGGGIKLTSLQLNKIGTGADPVVGVFGSLGGQEGIAAALRISPDQLDGISPNNVRINGCVALSTAGCIVTGLPLPLVQLNDPGRGLLINNAPDLILPVDLISGTTNEALWRDDEDDDDEAQAPKPAVKP